MATKRTIDTAEFKLQAVRMILDQKLSVAEVARRLDVGENLLHAWRIADHASEWPITWMCDTLEVSLSGYHAWHQQQPSVSTQRRETLIAAIHQIHADVKQRYGSGW